MIAIDLGSNTIRFIEYDGTRWGKSYEKIVRAAEKLQATNRIGENAVLRICSAIDEAKSHFDFQNDKVVAVTTAALRMAENGEDVIARIEEHSGVRFTIIDGVEEAKLTLMAVKNRLDQLQINTKRFLLADIGGGSTELIHYSKKETTSVSLPIGIVTMSEKATDKTMLRSLLDKFEAEVALFRESLDGKDEGDILVLTAGTPTTIAAYRRGMDYSNYDAEKINGSILTLDDCIQTHRELMEMEESLRAKYVGAGRELLIATGIMMVESLFKSIGMKEAIIVDDGLREGVALSHFNLMD